MSAFIDTHRVCFGVEPICRVLEASESAYYARQGPPSRRRVDDEALVAEIRRVHRADYGARRVWKQLLREGIDVGRGRVERLMRRAGIHGAQPTGRRRFLTVADELAPRPVHRVGADDENNEPLNGIRNARQLLPSALVPRVPCREPLGLPALRFVLLAPLLVGQLLERRLVDRPAPVILGRVPDHARTGQGIGQTRPADPLPRPDHLGVGAPPLTRRRHELSCSAYASLGAIA